MKRLKTFAVYPVRKYNGHIVCTSKKCKLLLLVCVERSWVFAKQVQVSGVQTLGSNTLKYLVLMKCNINKLKYHFRLLSLAVIQYLTGSVGKTKLLRH